MYDINYKNLRKGRNFWFIFLAFGIIFLVVFIWMFFLTDSSSESYDSETTAYNIIDNCSYDSEGSYMCSPIYYYEVDGKNYKCNSNFSTSMSIDHSKNKIYYDSQNPSNCKTEFGSSFSSFVYIFIIIPIVFVIVAVWNIMKANKRIRKVKYLANHGTLFKGLRYTLKSTGITKNGVEVLAPVVDFTLPSGSTIQLTGDARHDGISYDADGLVDLLIDLDHPDTYYIDFEINHKQ